MHTTQTTLTSDTDDAPNGDPPITDDTPTTTTPTESANHTTLVPPEHRGGTDCCPWCLAAAETFNHHDDGSVGCGHCDTAIPIGIPWYERGEKIVV